MRRRKVPWLDTRPGGDVYYAFWYDAKERRTKRLSLDTADPEEAQGRFAAFLVEGVTEFRVDSAVLTCGQVLDDYLNERVRPAGSKVAAPEVQEDKARLLKLHFGSVPVIDVTDEMVATYLTRRASGDIGRGAGDATVRRDLAVLISAINHAVRRRRISRDAVPHIEKPDDAEPRDRWLRGDELAKLLEAVEPKPGERLSRLHRFVHAAYYTAGRRASIEGLQWFQFDLDAQIITLNPRGRSQTKKRRPIVPIASDFMPCVRRAFSEKTSAFYLDAGRPIYREFSALAASLGLDDVTPHTLRHSRAVHLAQRGVDLWVIAGLLGDTMKTVERHYLVHFPDHIRAKIDGQVPAPTAKELL